MISQLLRIVRRIAGMPDYRSYLEHRHRCHPGEGTLSEREYFEAFLASRYGSGASRCC